MIGKTAKHLQFSVRRTRRVASAESRSSARQCLCRRRCEGRTLDKPLFMSRWGFDESDVSFSHTATSNANRSCGIWHKPRMTSSENCSVLIGSRPILVRSREKCGFVGIGRRKPVERGWDEACQGSISSILLSPSLAEVSVRPDRLRSQPR